MKMLKLKLKNKNKNTLQSLNYLVKQEKFLMQILIGSKHLKKLKKKKLGRTKPKVGRL